MKNLKYIHRSLHKMYLFAFNTFEFVVSFQTLPGSLLISCQHTLLCYLTCDDNRNVYNTEENTRGNQQNTKVTCDKH